jgi:hypothetical protein
MLQSVKVGHGLIVFSSTLFTYLLHFNLTTFCKLGRRNCYIARHHDKMEPVHSVWTSLVFALTFALSVLFHVWHSSYSEGQSTTYLNSISFRQFLHAKLVIVLM